MRILFAVKLDIEASVERLASLLMATSSELKASHTTLEDTVAHWKRYASCRDILIVMLDKTERMIRSRGVSRV